jgi:hypothetical protein
MENRTKITSDEVLSILKDYKNSSNKDLEKVMDFLNEDFERTKDLLIKLSTHLDSTKDSYNKLYEEYKKRNYGSI